VLAKEMSSPAEILISGPADPPTSVTVFDVGLSRADPAWIAAVKRRIDPSLVSFHVAEPVVRVT
jgi:hypothetical protein